MRQLKKYIERFFKQLYDNELSYCLASLYNKIREIDYTIFYTQRKKTHLQLLIDRQTVALENKYIDLLDEQHVQCPEKIHDENIAKMKHDLNEIEYEYAHLEQYLNHLSDERKQKQQACDLLLSLKLAY